MARTMLIAGNWKMNKTLEESVALAKELVEKAGDVTDRQIMVAPTYTNLYAVNEVVKGTSVKLGAQNMSAEASGAFTGEISADMLLSVGVSHVILGHSERREIFGETDELINKKVKVALEKALVPVFCCGEKLEEREAGKAEEVVESQIRGGLAGLSADEMKKVVIAYEPVWAIGTGKTATPDDADSMHASIRKVVTDMFSADVANDTQILYGGSVKDTNADELMNMENIDGGLVGGASLKADTFARIIKYVQK